MKKRGWISTLVAERRWSHLLRRPATGRALETPLPKVPGDWASDTVTRESTWAPRGQEFPAYDPRAYNGMSLAYATNNRGADHLRAFTPAAEIFGMPYMLDPGSPEGKAELVVSLQNENSIHDSTGLCLFISAGNDLEDIRKLLVGVTGVELTMEDMNTIGGAGLEPGKVLQPEGRPDQS